MKKIRVGNTVLGVRQEGQGPPLLLVHGFPFDHSMWKNQIAEFSKDHQVIAPDLRSELDLSAAELSSLPAALFLGSALMQLPVGVPFAGLLIFLGVMLVTGGLLGGFVFGAFLVFSLNVMNLQWTNAFSSLRVKDYKNFLRMKIDKNGGLMAYPVGIERTGDDATTPILIEPGFPVT